MADTPNSNGNIYPRSVLEKVCSQIMDGILENRLVAIGIGPIVYDEGMPVQQKAPVTVIDTAEVTDDGALTIRCVKMPANELAKAIENGAIEVGFSMACSGQLGPDKKTVVEADFIGIELVKLADLSPLIKL
jgi:hypothetical protein